VTTYARPGGKGSRSPPYAACAGVPTNANRVRMQSATRTVRRADANRFGTFSITVGGYA